MAAYQAIDRKQISQVIIGKAWQRRPRDSVCDPVLSPKTK
jgi:hypothetical protein